MTTMSRAELRSALEAGATVHRTLAGVNGLCEYRLLDGEIEFQSGRDWRASNDETLTNLTVTFPQTQPTTPGGEGKKFDADKPRMSLVPVGVVNALLRIDRENDGGPEGVFVYDLLRDLCDELIDGEYDQALHLCLRALCDDTVHGPLAGLDAVLKVLEFGAKKYDENNWMLLPDAKNRYTNAAWRHVLAMVRGEVNDPETGHAHAAHLGCNLVFLAYLEQGGKL